MPSEQTSRVIIVRHGTGDAEVAHPANPKGYESCPICNAAGVAFISTRRTTTEGDTDE